jgi:C-terminal processing protease CtpA/Prc
MGDVNGDWSEPAGSARLGEDHLSQWLASFGGSMTQWGLGGSSQDTSGLGGGSASTWQKGVYDAPTELAQTCANPRQNATYQDALGTTADENNWIRSWTNDSYLWYEDLPDLDPSSIDNSLDYFDMMRTEELTPTGSPVDPLANRWTIDTEVFLSEYAGSASFGYGMHLLFFNPVESRRIFVAFNLPGTPAAGALVDRGTEIIAIDGEPVAGGNVSVILAALAPSVLGESHIFQVREIGAFFIRTVTMQSAEIIPTPVPIYRAIDRAETLPLGTTKSVGYVLFNEHSTISEAQLIDGVDALIAAEVDELVLDLRYNSGGLAYVAAQLAYMIVGDAALNQTFYRPTYNDKYQMFDPVNSQLIQDMPFLDVTVGAPSLIGRPLNTPLPSLDLFRVFILADWWTCSSSELIINGLRGIGIEVILVGGTTCGKPYGGVPVDNCGTTYYMIQQKTANAVGFGDYADGFRPTQQTDNGGSAVRGCSVIDDLTQPLGQVNEAMLNTALHYIAQGACPPTSMAVRQKHASPWNATLQKTPVSGTAIMGLPRGIEASRNGL